MKANELINQLVQESYTIEQLDKQIELTQSLMQNEDIEYEPTRSASLSKYRELRKHAVDRMFSASSQLTNLLYKGHIQPSTTESVCDLDGKTITATFKVTRMQPSKFSED